MSILLQPSPVRLGATAFYERYGQQRYELVRGLPVEVAMPGARHGVVANWMGYHLTQFVVANKLRRVMTNDTFVVLRRDPDTVRGPDVCFVSYARSPRGPVPDGPLEVIPELVIEVRSPSDRWTHVIQKATEYLQAGVAIAIVIDPSTESVTVYRPDARQQIFEREQSLVIEDLLPGFTLPVAELFV